MKFFPIVGIFCFSEAGATLPESGVFTALLAIEAFLSEYASRPIKFSEMRLLTYHFFWVILVAVCVFLRYRLIAEYAESEDLKTLSFCNYLALVIGTIASLGTLVLAAYPVSLKEFFVLAEIFPIVE